MPLDKSIHHGKEFRRPYYDSRRFDRTCRNHGACGYCYNRRVGHKLKRLAEWTKDMLKETEE